MLVPIDSVAGNWKKNLPPEIDKIIHAEPLCRRTLLGAPRTE